MSLFTALTWMLTWDELEAYAGEPESEAAEFAHAYIGWRRRRIFRREIERLMSCGKHDPVVYFMRVGRCVKIGTTTNLCNRMLSFYLGPDDVLAVVPGGRRMESAYHSRFRGTRVRGDERAEAFRLDWRLRLFLSRRRIDLSDAVIGYCAAVVALEVTILWLHRVALLAALLTLLGTLAMQFFRPGWHYRAAPSVWQELKEATGELRAKLRRTS